MGVNIINRDDSDNGEADRILKIYPTSYCQLPCTKIPQESTIACDLGGQSLCGAKRVREDGETTKSSPYFGSMIPCLEERTGQRHPYAEGEFTYSLLP